MLPKRKFVHFQMHISMKQYALCTLDRRFHMIKTNLYHHRHHHHHYFLTNVKQIASSQIVSASIYRINLTIFSRFQTSLTFPSHFFIWQLFSSIFFHILCHLHGNQLRSRTFIKLSIMAFSIPFPLLLQRFRTERCVELYWRHPTAND